MPTPEIIELNSEIYDSRIVSHSYKRIQKKGIFRFFQKGILSKKEKRISQLLDRQYIHNKPVIR